MKVITFFSYKGGAGRTVACGNIAAALASARSFGLIKEALNHRVALLDLDVFSAGAHRVFDIGGESVQERDICIQDYLLSQITPREQLERGAIRLEHEEMREFREHRAAAGNCRDDFLLFPARPEPDQRFAVAKYHENLLLELLLELEQSGYEYVVLDGEAGARSMADIAMRLSDVVVMLFRLTWQHIEGTMAVARSVLKRQPTSRVYLLPTCVPLVGDADGIYQEHAPGLTVLKASAESIPEHSKLNKFAETNRGTVSNPGMGYLWAQRMCIHESLILVGSEQVLMFDPVAKAEQAGRDYYAVARELSRLHPPS